MWGRIGVKQGQILNNIKVKRQEEKYMLNNHIVQKKQNTVESKMSNARFHFSGTEV